MRFKKALFIVLGVCQIATTGCGPFLDGKKSEPQVIEFSNKKLQCLQVLPAQLKKFSVGLASNKEIQESTDCLAISLRYFTERTYGSKEGLYSIEEIRLFFSKYFLKENSVTPDFASELMKIKQALLGGSTQDLSKTEIGKLIELLKVVQEEAISLNPYIKILLNQSEKTTIQQENISVATAQLRKSLQRLLLSTQISNSDYNFSNAKQAIAGFAEFISGGFEFAPYQRYAEWLPLIEALKNMLIGERAQMSGMSQWSQALDTVVDLYEIFLKYKYRIQNLGIKEQSDLREVSQFAQQVFKVLANSPQMQLRSFISTEDIDAFIDQLALQWELPFSTQAAKISYRVVLSKILEANPNGDNRALRGLEQKHLKSLQREFNIWRLQQAFIDTLPISLMDRGGLNQTELLQAYSRFDRLAQLLTLLTSDPFEQQILKTAWKDFGVVLQEPWPLTLTEKWQILVNSRLAEARQSWKSLSFFNGMRSLTRFLFLGYGQNTRTALTEKAYLTKQSLIDWYEDFYSLGVELKAFDPRSGNAGNRSFMEANFFTFYANGDDQLSFLETSHFIGSLFAAGLSSSAQLTQGMIEANCATSQMDPFDKPYFEAACFKQELHRSFARYFGNLPGMVQYVKSLNEAGWEQFYGHIMSIATPEYLPVGADIETAHTRTLVTVLHYIENMFVAFDTDRNQILNLAEVEAASPRFTPFFMQVTGQTNQTILRDGFSYLVFKGHIPSGLQLAGFQLAKLRKLEAQRVEILRLFDSLKEHLNAPAK